MTSHLTRRGFVAGATALAPGLALAAPQKAQLAVPATVISNPPRQWGPGAPVSPYPDPDVIVVDPAFSRLRVGLSGIKRIATGFQWAEGPAWCAAGQYALFSDVQGDVQYRYIWETGEITAFRKPSYNTNGNGFDYEGRQLSCQDFLRRVVRWEHDGSLKVLADNYRGQPLNSPNDIAAHKDGSVWFTDPMFGMSLAEGHPDAPGQGNNQAGLYDPHVGAGGIGIGPQKQELPANVYRWDPSGRLDIVVPFEAGRLPNGIALSPDCSLLYLALGGRLWVADINGATVSNLRQLSDCMIDGIQCGPDGFRVDRAGNIWASAGGTLGYTGIACWSPQGKLLGRIRLPEICANLCFAGPKRDHLFMTASQSIYLLRVGIQGAAPG